MNVGLTSCDDQTIRERVQAAGVVGAGGAGFRCQTLRPAGENVPIMPGQRQ